jgi:hypothetical protein
MSDNYQTLIVSLPGQSLPEVRCKFVRPTLQMEEVLHVDESGGQYWLPGENTWLPMEMTVTDDVQNLDAIPLYDSFFKLQEELGPLESVELRMYDSYDTLLESWAITSATLKNYLPKRIENDVLIGFNAVVEFADVRYQSYQDDYIPNNEEK